MKRKTTMLASLFLILVVIGTVSAAILWTSDPIQKEISISWGSAITIDTADVGNYALKVAPTTFQEYPDARSDSFAVALMDTNVAADDLVLTVDVIGAPEGTVTTVHMSYVCYFRRHFLDEHDEFQITAFNDAGEPQNILADMIYNNVDTTTFREIPAAGTIIVNADLSQIMYEEPQGKYFNEETEPTLADANGIWIFFDFDTSAVVGYGDWQLSITVSLSES